ncbi:NtaA/DmoA family FMN-dependent monooxygenase [Paenibacillaceae bacterium WGS1546]|uniref:NtaA/DmoA family FMN-dependent monooxygenase n=1 Tax=Cohnella sp. WGS1546 TaxID=3366810 RepID=UPI00372D6A47
MANVKQRQLCIGLSLTATWLKGKEAGREAAKGTQANSFDMYIELARIAERAKLDFVFQPDALVMRAWGGRSPGFLSLDPTLLLTLIATKTERIGLVTTISTTFNPPYVVARQLQSLHWISGGRAGWNIVTSLDGAENFTSEAMPSAEQRYAKAREFTDVVRKLWASYPYESLAADAAVDSGAERPQIKVIDHRGEYFSVKGPLNTPGHPKGTPPFFQAGASDTGRNFAASVADAIFASIPDMEAGVELCSDLRRRAIAQGRSEQAVRVLPGLYFFLAETGEQAQQLYEQAHAHLSRERRFASIEMILGVDLSHLSDNQIVTEEMLPDPQKAVRSRTHANLLRRYICEHKPQVSELLRRPEVVGSAHWVSVGTVDDVLQDIITWFEAGAMDGFIALPGGSVRSMELFFEQLVPKLVERGLYRSEYTGSSLREHLRIEEASEA